MTVTVSLVWEPGADTSLGLPAYESVGAAGVDLRANLPDRGSVLLTPGARELIPTGLRMSVPQGYEAQIRPRSGLALKHGLTLTNSPGTIDSDYRGPVGIILQNAGPEAFTVTHGMRIAQMVITPVIQADFSVSNQLDDTDRGSGGFGSTGIG